jgi:hypothetical protein
MKWVVIAYNDDGTVFVYGPFNSYSAGFAWAERQDFPDACTVQEIKSPK